MSDEQLAAWAAQNPERVIELLEANSSDRQATQLAYYQTANPMALPAHTSMAREICLVGGNRSSKTDTMLAELAIQMTGHIPKSLQGVYPREKIRAPIRARVVCNSLIDVLEPIIKPKLRWDRWNGNDEYTKGHWGWIPRHTLKNGKWEDSYSEKNRTLHVSVDNLWVGADGAVNSMRGWSTCQFMSYDQEDNAFEGASLHMICHDEIPKTSIYKIHQMRAFDAKGRLYTAFTPPIHAGERGADISWFYDNVYQRGLSGPNKHDNIDSYVLYTEANTALPLEEIDDLKSRLTSDEELEVRLKGAFLHLTGVIYKNFATSTSWWCFRCQRRMYPVNGTCTKCTGNDIESYCHVIEPFVIPPSWPVIMVIDPHPRKPDAIGWFAITPGDDIIMIGEMEQEGTATDIARYVTEWEKAHRVNVVRRLMDPNIATETNDKLDRGWTIRRAYDEAGLRCNLAADDVNMGVDEVQSLLRPDVYTRRPRLAVFSDCHEFIKGMTHWSWAEHANPADKEPKEIPRDRWKDFPDLIRYLALDRPTFKGYHRSDTRILMPTGSRGARGY